MSSDSIYIGAFGGSLACLFVATILLARIQRDFRLLMALIPIAGFACFFLCDRTALSGVIHQSETKTWMVTSIIPMLIGLTGISFLIAQSSKMKETAPNTFKVLMFATGLFGIAILLFLSPLVAHKYGPSGLDVSLEAWLSPLLPYHRRGDRLPLPG